MFLWLRWSSFNPNQTQENREFVNEVCMIWAPKHPNLVRLCGCRTERIICYKYTNTWRITPFHKPYIVNTLRFCVPYNLWPWLFRTLLLRCSVTRLLAIWRVAITVLTGHEGLNMELDWQMRHKICKGMVRSLAYLHEESRLKIVIEASKQRMPFCISAFGLTRTIPISAPG